MATAAVNDGYCRILPQYIVAPEPRAPPAVPTPEASNPPPPVGDSPAIAKETHPQPQSDRPTKKVRGQNHKREVAKVEGTEKPAFAGESNFVNDDLWKLIRYHRTESQQAWKQEKQRRRERQSQQDTPGQEAADNTEATECNGHTSAENMAEDPAVAENGAPEDPVADVIECTPAAAQEATAEAPTEDTAAVVDVVAQPVVPTPAAPSGDDPVAGTSSPPPAESTGAALDTETPLRPSEKRRLDFSGLLSLAPLTTLGNLPFRRICKRLGADVTCCEMAMGKTLLDGRPSEWSLLRRHASEDLFGLQVTVAWPDMATRLGNILENSGFEFDFIDLNCACPTDAICKYGVGATLLQNPGRIGQICQALGAETKRPLTIKVRTGFTEKKPLLQRFLPRLQDWGLSAWTVHGRSKTQRYTKLADWDYVAQCARDAPIPTLGSGDVYQWTEWYEHRERHNVATTLLARGALIKPWLFTEIKERRSWDIAATERLDLLKEFVSNGMDHWGTDDRGLSNTRRFLCEWLSFQCRYVPVGILESPQLINQRPPQYVGRNELETLMASTQAADWVKLSELVMGKAPEGFKFTPKHKSSGYATSNEDQNQVQG